MKLSKVKKVCTSKRQLEVVNTTGANNLITQWVGTGEAMYPLRDMQVTREQLQKLWELSDIVIMDMENSPVLVDAEQLETAEPLIDTKTAEKMWLCDMGEVIVLAPKDGNLMYIKKEYLEPCKGDDLHFVPMGGDWIGVYESDKIGAMVKTVPEYYKRLMDSIIRRAAKKLPKE